LDETGLVGQKMRTLRTVAVAIAVRGCVILRINSAGRANPDAHPFKEQPRYGSAAS